MRSSRPQFMPLARGSALARISSAVVSVWAAARVMEIRSSACDSPRSSDRAAFSLSRSAALLPAATSWTSSAATSASASPSALWMRRACATV